MSEIKSILIERFTIFGRVFVSSTILTISEQEPLSEFPNETMCMICDTYRIVLQQKETCCSFGQWEKSHG